MSVVQPTKRAKAAVGLILVLVIGSDGLDLSLRPHSKPSSVSYPCRFVVGPTRLAKPHRHPRLPMRGYRYPTVRLAGDSLSSEPSQNRPSWAWVWMPTWLFTMNPLAQFLTTMGFYLLHILVLSQRQLVFPIQLIPNEKGQFASIGYDSIAGILVAVCYTILRKASTQSSLQSSSEAPFPALFKSPTSDAPWKLPSNHIRHRVSSFLTIILLVQAYFFTGRFSLFWEDTLYTMSGLGWPLTAPMHRSLCVLFGHLSWLITGTLLLRFVPRPPRFFGPKAVYNTDDDDAVSSESPAKPAYRWFRSSIRRNWVWWVVGGYFVSSWLFNITDVINQFVLPTAVLEDAQESVVSQLVNPEHNDIAASVAGYIAPCLTAPWWEEVLYRGFLLAGLSQLLGYPWAVFVQGLIFSAHHMSLTAALPLAVLGWTWAILYTKCRNLFTVIFVHALWNSRVFLGSWLGL